ncbi:unnamed protein product [Meloidogyne enterolobii]|uniref:Uncharacterized protein n=1 Tax=Meloidogyne enterolobii TaxID=390850 RepID=A0ACB1ACF1_MELEN
MTSGRVIILCGSGKNFAAALSGVLSEKLEKIRIMPRTSSNSNNRRRPNNEQSPGPPRRQLRIITSPTPPPVESLQQPIQNVTNATINTNPDSQVPASEQMWSLYPAQQNQVDGMTSTNAAPMPMPVAAAPAQIVVVEEADRMPQEIAAQILAKRQNRFTGHQPEGARFITLDETTGCTATDMFMLPWEKDQVFSELIGDVVYSHRGPTAKNGWDRGDCHVQIGQAGEIEKICVFAWKQNASRLEGAKINQVNFLNLKKNLIY